jgi:Holliday junction resolvase RusA-like endonuclease
MPPDSTTVYLPYPPSSNNLYPTGRNGKRFPSPEYQKWKTVAGLMLNRQNPPLIPGAVSVIYELRRFEDKRRRDISNREKCLGDILVSHGLIEDDSKIEELTMRWVRDVPWEVKITISKVEP